MDVTKANGSREVFDPSKLRSSLINSGASDGDTEKVVDHIEAELTEGMSTSEIYRHAFEFLKELNMPIAHSYSLRRAVMSIGPTGFPFEKLVAEIYKAQGYEAVVDQVVMGKCVAHEVDVVAWKDNELIMVEAKYHNELGTKSDLKVILGVKARWDDLKSGKFNYGGKERSLAAGVLITNTKFSSTAIQYGKCEGLAMIGWNYPQGGSLQEMIEKNPKIQELIFQNKQQ